MDKGLRERIDEKKERLFGFLLSEDYREYLTKESLKEYVNVEKEDELIFEAVINELIEEGRLVVSKRKRLVPYVKLGYHIGELRTTAEFGFVTCEDLNEDVFIQKACLNGAAHKDRVQISINARTSKGLSGSVKKVLKRGLELLSGTYVTRKKKAYVIPDDKNTFKKIFIPKDGRGKAREDDKVVVKLIAPPGRDRIPMGKITEVLGSRFEAGVDISSIVAGMGIPHIFPKEVKECCEKISEDIAEEELKGREDFRDVTVVTIDGEDAKDLDDAVSCRLKENGNYELGVYIADVSHYVKEGSPIDKEALKRGTSVYLPDRVVPMLPEKLSNGLCSLNEGCDRLTLCCIMEIDRRGRICDHRIVKGVIRSEKRLTYTGVNAVLEGDEKTAEEYGRLVPMIWLMKELRDILFKKRQDRGAIGFDFDEAGVILDGYGKPVDVVLRQRNTATSIIEEFMIAANETVAEEYVWLDLPFMFRSHGEPEGEKYDELKRISAKLGYVLRGDRKNPKNLQKLLEAAKGRDNEMMISRMTLRSMQQASYTADCQGHFGLASKYYCHFTSPIRRYPDLFIHRIISLTIGGTDAGELRRRFGSDSRDRASLCSDRERRAEAAERDALLLKKTEYMADRIGEIFEGIICGFNSRGMFVQLPDTIEGMVSYKNMRDDSYEYDEEGLCCVGRRSHMVYSIGDRVKVMAERADIETRHIDFGIV